VTFNSKPRTHRVRNLDSTAVIFFRTDGVAATVNGDDTDRLGSGERLEVDAANVDPPQVQLISSGTPRTRFARGELMTFKRTTPITALDLHSTDLPEATASSRGAAKVGGTLARWRSKTGE
jgi:hypothetical protein